MKLKYVTALIAATLLTSPVAASEFIVSQKARDIAQNNMIIDTHIDAPWRLQANWVDLTSAVMGGDFDYQRAKAGGLTAPFMAIYVPVSYEDNGAFNIANQLIDQVEAMVYRAPDKYAIPYSVADLKVQFEQGLISLPMGIENGAPLEGKLDNVQHFYDRGVRYITLTHSEDNHISDSSYDTTNTWGGLSPFGKRLVTEMNKVGMMIDISHVTDAAFYDVLKISKAPVIASHSSARHFTPGWQRNMSDEMIVELAKHKGVIQVTFGSSFVSQEANQYRNKINTLKNQINERHGENTPAAKAAIEQMLKENPYPYAHVNDVIDHIDHIVKLTGIDYVGIGSDFDGVGDSLPKGLKDVSMFPNLIQGLLDRGYSEQDIEKILYKNILRVWTAVEGSASN